MYPSSSSLHVRESRQRVGFRVEREDGRGVGDVTVVETEKKVVVEPGECRRWGTTAGAPPPPTSDGDNTYGSRLGFWGLGRPTPMG
jgi:hypothetical protein